MLNIITWVGGVLYKLDLMLADVYAVVLTCVAVFCISLGPAVGIRVCPGGCIEVSLCNRITIAVLRRCTYCILHIRWHCVSCRIKDIVCNLS